MNVPRAIVIGSGSLSFEMIRALVERLPVMVTPRWVALPAQPIGITDVLAYLLEARVVAVNGNATYEIGGADRVSYGDIMREYARQRGLRRLMLPVPFLTPHLSSLWLGLVTPLYARVGRKLIDSIRHATVVRDVGGVGPEAEPRVAPGVVDLQRGARRERCRRVGRDIGRARRDDGDPAPHRRRLRVATKYAQLTRSFFAQARITDYRIVPSAGATEGAPAAGTAEVIVDITTTGATLKDNGLKILDDGVILKSQAQLAASLTADWTTRRSRLAPRTPASSATTSERSMQSRKSATTSEPIVRIERTLCLPR